MHDYKKLEVWKKSLDLVKDIYELSKGLPSDERYGLTSQIRRSAVSIPSNIAEGCGRGTDKQLCYFLDVALGSSYELETQLIICEKLELINNTQIEEIIKNNKEVSKMIYGFRKSVKSKV